MIYVLQLNVTSYPSISSNVEKNVAVKYDLRIGRFSKMWL